MTSRELILNDIRRSLGRDADSPVAPRPPVVPARRPGSFDQEIDRFLAELTAVNGDARRLRRADLATALAGLVQGEHIQKAVLWETELLGELGIGERLQALGVEIIPHTADKDAMAQADLGVTEADSALAETGTIGLYSSPSKPRAVSLLPRVHLAIISPAVFQADLHQVFAEARSKDYLVFVTGPSRTADIEMTSTIGAHGPKAYYAWVLDQV